MHYRHRSVLVYPSVRSRHSVGKIPGINCKASFNQTVFFVKTLSIACNIINCFFKLRQTSRKPFIITCDMIIICRSLNNKILNIRFNFKAHKCKIIISIQLITVFIHILPMIIVVLFYQLKKLTVFTLCFNNKIEKIVKSVFPMLACFHHMDMISYPVNIANHKLSVYKSNTSVSIYIASELINKLSQSVIGCCENPRKSEFIIVVCAVSFAVCPHTREFMLKFYHNSSFLPAPYTAQADA